jgi:DNA polymerase-3 subunit alpha (Gram-positive type)
VAAKTAYGYVKGYLEKTTQDMRKAEIDRTAKIISGVKRSTGQHPGGIVVVPFDKEITDVTPVQYPADDVTGNWQTTHFDYHSFEANLFKLDVLGHDDPTMIKLLMDYVKASPLDFPFADARDIPLDDPKVYQLLSGTEVIGLTKETLRSAVASYGVPEMGTSFVRGMLEVSKPNTFADIVKISGLSHGTDVWLNNAEMLVTGKHKKFAQIPFKEVIGCRDDIMVSLIQYGISKEIAFEISEFIRKGKPSKEIEAWEGYITIMKDHEVPDWYIWSCGQIKYMFPKAHATAYVMMALRIAWFKVYRPIYFYAAYFSVRAKDFDLISFLGGPKVIESKIEALEEKGTKATDTEKRLLTVLEVALEMTLRGFHFEPIDISLSGAKDFSVTTDKSGLRLPFVALEGLGQKVAESIVAARDEKIFNSHADVKERTLVSKTVFDKLLALDALKTLPEDTQVRLFDI